ncbi:hypothetical protein BX600DRAFT_512838 [Xylariales sp. PMI_506]|nr:hypothetical protein BX600DRAFT_512838 [Xylariales sp. PMI_506]
MAFNGPYPEQQRPYAGPAAQRPAARGNFPPQQQFDPYQDGYGYDQQYDDGYGNDYGPPPPDMNYGRGGPDPYGPGPGRGGGRPPQRGGRGGPRGGGPGPGPGRGGFPGPGRGGRPGPLERSASSDPSADRAGGPLMISPQEQDFGSPFPVFPGQRRKTDLDEEARILDDMKNMSFNDGGPRRPPPGRGNLGPRGPPARRPTMDDGYGGRPSMDSQRGGPRGPPPQGFPDRRGPPPGPGYGGFQQDDGYGGPMSPGQEQFGPPGRSMTMPNSADPMGMRNGGPPPRMDSAPYNGPVGRGGPPRPSTAQGNRPPPQRMYPNQGPPGPPGPPRQVGPPPEAWDAYEPPRQGWGGNPVRASFGDFYDAYYHQGNNEHPPLPGHEEVPEFDAMPPQNSRGSFDQHMRPGPGGPGMPQQGPARQPELSRTKSQPNLREPQTAVFEMAGEMPPLPNGGFQAYNGQPAGLPSGPGSMRGLQSGPGAGPPAPIRPGLMPNSIVNMNDKPPPQRQYNGPPPAAIGAQGRPPPQAMAPNAEPEHIPVTIDELEHLRAIIKDNPNDQASALSLAKKLVEAADVLVPKLPDPKARTRARERYVMDAHKILKKLASAQNPEAMFFLADCLGRGALGLEPDNKEAFTLYQSAAKVGHAAAAYRTAVCCELGNDEGGGTRKDPLKAIQWYKRAATLGDTPAMYKVGMIMLKGLLGQQKNPREAVGWLKRAAERADPENPHALHELGLLYESAQPNDVILRDEAYAFTLFEQAASLGYKFSQFRMGCAYEYGLMGCPIDPRLSIMWYSRAAAQEEHQSELALSGWYLTGTDGVLQQSDTEAYLWARKAAQAGLAKAEYAMGYFTEVGIGIPANLEDAKRWYWRAAAQNFPKARERLEDLKRTGGKNSGPRPRERISRSKIGKQQEGECSVM